jgi:hypothetical protein
MREIYKRIISIDSEHTSDLLSHACNSVSIRPGRCGQVGEYILETTDPLERRKLDKLVELFDNGR